VLKDFLDYIRLVDETDDPHLALALGTGKRICFIDFSDEVRPSFLYNPSMNAIELELYRGKIALHPFPHLNDNAAAYMDMD